MFDAAGDDAELAGLEDNPPVAKFNGHLAAPDEEKLIFVFVVMPGEDAAKLDELEFLAIQRGNDFRTPMLVDGGELFIERTFCHSEL